MTTFKDQVAITTGGAQGIGRAVAERLASDGARIAVWDIDAALAEKAAIDIGKGAIACQVDVSDWESVSAAMARTLDATARVDILVNSAGIAGINETLADYPVAEFQHIMDVNLVGTFHVNRAVVPTMKTQGYGRIVNIASVAGKEGNPNASAYSASKAGVIGLTKSLGKELADLDIAVNLRHSRRSPYPHLRSDEAGAHRLHAVEDPARKVPRTERGGGDDRLARECREQLHHRRCLRSFGWARDLLNARNRRSEKLEPVVRFRPTGSS